MPTTLQTAAPAEDLTLAALPGGRRGGTVAHRPPAGRWRIDGTRSTLQISVKVGFVATVTGRFTTVSGHLELADDLEDSSIDVEVRTSSLTSGSSHWDTVLTNAGLIDTAANPTIQFEATELTAVRTGWRLDGVLITSRGYLPVSFDLRCVGLPSNERVAFRATGSLQSKDAVRLLSQPGVEKLVGKTMAVDLTIEAVRD